jgi:hypothetical protein
MAKARIGGWFKQPERHSRARKYGQAGGQYASQRVTTILAKHPEYKNLSFKQLKGKGIFLKYQSDADRDGVKNIKDCKPLNSHEQDLKETTKKVGAWVEKEAKIGYEKTKEFVKKETPKIKAFVKKEAEAIKEKVKKEYDEYKRKRREAVGRAVAQATQQNLIDEQTEEQKSELIDKLSEMKEGQESTEISSGLESQMTPISYPEFNVSHIFNQLKPEEAQRIAERTTKALTKAEHRNVEELADVDVKELSDDELKMITVRLGTGFFGQGNRFESEIKRRIRERERVETDLKIELEKAQLESKKRLEQIEKDLNKEAKGGYVWDDIFGTKKIK